MASKFCGLDEMGLVLAEMLGEYTIEINAACEAGAQKAAEVFVKHAEVVSPVYSGKYPHSRGYKNNWAIKPAQYPRRRYVGNTTRVPGKGGKSQIPLINILEKSTTRGHKHVRKAIEASKNEVLEVFKKHLEEAK